MNNTEKEIEDLITEIGKGRGNRTDKGEYFWQLVNKVMANLNNRPVKEIEIFAEYLKEVAKHFSKTNIIGFEPQTVEENFYKRNLRF